MRFVTGTSRVLPGCERDEQPAVLVVRREHVDGDRLTRPERDRSSSRSPSRRTPHSSASATGLRPSAKPLSPKAETLRAHQLGLAVAGQLEHARPEARIRAVAVARDEAGARSRVVVVEQLEEEAEPASLARGRLTREPLEAVVVDRRGPCSAGR